MAVAAFANGTQSTSGNIGTEIFLSNVNVAGVYTLHIDTSVLAAGDVLQVRVYQIVLTGGTARVCYVAQYTGAQPTDDMIKVSPPIGNELTDSNSLRFSINQTFGTARSFPWKVLSY